jgi:phosphoglycolate phosphatase-like HAD superfamily hydrolase
MSFFLNQLETIVFDFDGVIADTDQGRFALLSDNLKDFHIDLSSTQQVKDLVGLSTKTFINLHYPQLSDAQVSMIISKRHDYFFSNLEKYCIPNSGMYHLLDFLKKSGKLLAIATTNKKENTIILLEYLKIDHLIFRVFGRETTENICGFKTYDIVKKELGIQSLNSVIIEDSLIGVKAAKAANLTVVAINKNPDKEICQNADLIFSDLNELYHHWALI